MRAMLAVALILGMAGSASGGESVTMPWEEFKRLYAESVRREVMKGLPEKEPPAVAAIEEAVYRLTVGAKSAAGRVLITGRALAGRPEPLRLLADDAVVAGIVALKGGTLLTGEGGLFLLPAANAEFQVELSLLAPVREDGRSKFVALRVPAAARNSLTVVLPAGARLLAHPGIAGADGVVHFASAGGLELRFEEQRQEPAPVAPEIDVLTRISLQGRKVLLAAHFQPARPVPGPLVVKLPAGAQCVGSSLKGSWVGPSGADALKLELPAGFAEGFALQCALERPGEDGDFAFALPAVEGNAGREGFFILEEPEDADVRVAGDGLAAGFGAARLPAALREEAGGRPSCLRLGPGGRVALSVRRFQAVKAPEVVLDSLSFFTAFEESGGALSVLRVKLPAGAGPRLAVRRVPGAEIWFLKVNGERKEVYSLDQESWIVPLARERDSEVELAFLRRGAKLGLQGRLEAVLPGTGLSARKLLFGVALPPRVDLVSVEGDLSPEKGDAGAAPAEFAGRRYHFSRSFYKGEELKAALGYKEPVDPEEKRRGP
jgi:hypothetical protein